MKTIIFSTCVFCAIFVLGCGDSNSVRSTNEAAIESILEYFDSFKDTTYILDSISVKNVVEFDDENYKGSLQKLGSFFCNVDNTKIDSLLEVTPTCSKYYIVFIHCQFTVDKEVHVSDSLPMLLDEDYNIIEYI